jgi:preprotein translocase subunit SecY
MDIADGLYGFFGTSDPATLILDLLVAVVLAVSVAYLAMELYRIYVEYTRREAPAGILYVYPQGPPCGYT